MTHSTWLHMLFRDCIWKQDCEIPYCYNCKASKLVIKHRNIFLIVKKSFLSTTINTQKQKILWKYKNNLTLTWVDNSHCNFHGFSQLDRFCIFLDIHGHNLVFSYRQHYIVHAHQHCYNCTKVKERSSKSSLILKFIDYHALGTRNKLKRTNLSRFLYKCDHSLAFHHMNVDREGDLHLG